MTPQSEARAWNKRLKDEQKALLMLVQDIEAEFVATSDGIEYLSRQLDEIQKECQSLADLTLGLTQDAAVQFAFQLLKKAEDLVLASYDQYDLVFSTFQELQQRLAQASKQRDELMRVLLPLSVITMSFRIEASRHPAEVQQAFFTLSENVNRTVHDVRSAMERQFDELAASEQIARSLIGQISASVQQHRKEVTFALAASRSQLGALNEALIRAGAGATGLSQRNKTVTSHLNRVVMAIQYQDITRQRIEHVAQAIDEMRMHLDDGRTPKPAIDTDARQFVFQAGQIQLQQVQNVFDQLNHAADRLKSGIQSLHYDAGAAAELAVNVGGTALDAKVASQCQAGISEILGIVKQAVQRIAEIIAAFAPLQARFVDCTAQATALAGDVRRAGLNAQIFAIQTTGGATLEVLAVRVHAISEEVIELVERMGDLLGHTSGIVSNLRQRLEDFQILGQAEETVLADESKLSMQKLADLENTIPLLVQGVTHRQGTFAKSVEKVLANIQFPETVAQASSRSIGFFQDLLAWGAAGASGLLDNTSASQIDQLKSKYTMESERYVHAAALQPVPAPAKAADFQPAIELFDDPALPPICTALGTSSSPGENADNQAAPPPALSANETTPPPPACADGKSSASAGLGDNVELF